LALILDGNLDHTWFLERAYSMARMFGILSFGRNDSRPREPCPNHFQSAFPTPSSTISRSAWSDSGGAIESRFSKDELLTNLMVYWATGTAPASVRMYYEFLREPLATGRIEAPVGMLMSTKDLFPAAPREWGERFFNVQRWVETSVGGHFLEWEEPELVARELQAFFGSVTPKP
jgi:pimeloyl-ACP methyl ester carboxylesterase